MLRLLMVLLCVGPNWLLAQQKEYNGKILDQLTKEPLIGVTISVVNSSKGCVSAADGTFKIKATSADTLQVSYIGYQTTLLALTGKSKNIQIFLVEHNTHLSELNITAKKDDKLELAQAGLNVINSKMLSLTPAIAGEKDIIRTAQLMPGIKAGADGLGGMYVRGGNADQNLVLLNGATVYNASHLVGFFSVFNSSVLNDVKLYKGNFPSKYGGRTSSVLDISTHQANLAKPSANITLGALAANITVNAPLVKDKLAMQVAVRRSYVNYLFMAVGNSLPYYFYDLNINLTQKLAKNSWLIFNHYQGKDVLTLTDKNAINNNFGSNMGNTASSIQYKITNHKLSFNSTFSHTKYNYGFTSNLQNNLFNLKSNINDFQLNNHVAYNVNNNRFLHVGFGGNASFFAPNKTSINGTLNEDIKESKGQKLRGLNLFTYAEVEQHVNKFKMVGGLRLSNAVGNNFNYLVLEPRASVNYKVNSKDYIAFAYNKMTQPVHLINGSGILMPSDIWYPVTQKIKPQIAHQLSLTYNKNIGPVNLVIESYYKQLKNLVEYREGTVVFLNNQLEDDLILGKGRTYGGELMVQKTEGNFTGWLSYTLSWSKRKFNELNYGKEFSSVFDRRHDFNLVAGYQLNKKLSFNALFVWASGSKVTPIVGSYLMPSGSLNDLFTVPIYGNRNSQSLAATVRLDLGLTYKPKQTKKYVSEWQIGAYNVLNRTQPFRVKINNDNGKLTYQQLGLFGFVPSISYNIKF